MALFEREEIRQRYYLSLVASTALLWDWAISVEDEFQHIWRSPSITNKWVYLISRYLGIISQLVDNIIIFSNGYEPVPENICQRWICFETAVSMILFALTEFLQVLRVYAFYHKNSKLGIFLVTWFFAEMGGAAYYIWYMAVQMDFDSSCSVVHVALINTLYPVVVLASQATILFLLLRRRKVIAPGALGNVPVAFVVLRDGTSLFLANCGIIGVGVAYAMKLGHPLFIAPVLNATLSIAACRMALNLQSIKRPCLEETSLQYSMNLTTLLPSTGVMPTSSITAPPHSLVPSLENKYHGVG